MKEVRGATETVRLRHGTFIALALLINIVDGTLTRSATDPQHRLILASASCFDVVVVVLALYYWLLVRPRIRTISSMIMIGLLAVLRASFLFPNGGRAKMLVAGVCELGFIAILIIYVQQTRKITPETDADPVAAIRTAVRRLLPLPVAVNAVTAELAILYYALFSWRAKPHIPANAQAFTNYKRIGRVDLLGVLPVACVLEIIPVHLLLERCNSAIAWTVTCLSAYAVIWVVGLARSFRLRPTFVTDHYVCLRYGLIFQLQAPWGRIACIRRAEANDIRFAVPRKSEPSHCIEFVGEMTAEGLFGFQRRLTRVAVTLDD